MKKIITSTSILVALFFTINATAQRWERGNERINNDHANRVVYRGDENRRGYDRDDRRVYDIGNYYRDENRGYYRGEPRVVYHREYCQPQRVTYFYYPSANVYYNPINRLFTYPCHGEWVNATALPYGFYVNEPYQEVYCNAGENICVYNNVHRDAFRSYVNVRHCAPVEFRLSIRL